MKRLTLLVCALCLASAGLWAQKAIVDQTPVVEEFTGFLGNGFAPNPIAGQLDSDEFAILGFSQGVLNFGGTQITGSFARGTSTGGVIPEGVYAYTTVPLNFLFIQPGDIDFTPGYLTIRYINNHVDPITSLDVSYSVMEMNEGPRSSSWNLSYSTNDVIYTAVPALNFSSQEALDPPSGWLAYPRSTTLDLSLTPVASGAFFYLRFSSDDVSGSGDRDEIGFDHLTVTATNLPVELERVSVE